MVRKVLAAPYEEESHAWCVRMVGIVIRTRKEKGWSQEQLGAMLGMSQSAVALMERNPDSAYAMKLNAALNALGLEVGVQQRGHAKRVRREREAKKAANDGIGKLKPAA